MRLARTTAPPSASFNTASTSNGNAMTQAIDDSGGGGRNRHFNGTNTTITS